ncbi:deoxyribose-phosphate aldolase [Marinoscillum furvescens]|uniref:Deoxyribose-phosphate aldolase n=1 Tax=Marinoscillum furvescens DSM 4134 TaxID=1122208 RepID=A0A3D9L5D1_MARFU|nr:deoxyribose-phosphate aldolase [Marinoscillum furvescens]REE01233.1 deoxyribose-phosphate aldolase [Marinoscillum furvescens DSM 4134]
MKSIARFIESTNLSPTLTGKDVDALVAEAKALEVLGVCVPPFWVKRAAREIAEDDLQLVTVVGFPLGYQMTETKIEEARLAIRDGANELDIVWSISAFKDGMPWPKIELAKLSKVAHDEEVLLKVIIEVAYLSSQEIEMACRICADAGVDFVKTSTGFAKGGEVTPDHIAALRGCLPSNVGIKASGGIRTKEQALNLITAGADRIGTSSARAIITD